VFIFSRNFYPVIVATKLFMVEPAGVAIENGMNKIDAWQWFQLDVFRRYALKNAG
jgi:hypothetical protein